MKFTDLMIDIETTGKNPGCAIIQIAAVPFNINTGEISENTFCVSINLEGQILNGLNVDEETINWWKVTNEDLFKKLSFNNNDCIEVAKLFESYFRSIEDYSNVRVWGNSARFDIGILYGWYKILNKDFKPFWNTWKERDVRTLSSLDEKIKMNTVFEGEKHNAIDDCKHQIKYCREIVKKYYLKVS